MPNPYEVLGVHPDAGTEDIKRAYKRLVRECHPDLHPTPIAEMRFKQVSSAYSVLNDPQQRQLYDEFGEMALQPGFDPVIARKYAAPSNGHGHDAHHNPAFHDLNGFGDIFGAAFANEEAQAHAVHGEDQKIRAPVAALLTFTGGMTNVAVPRHDGSLESIRIRVNAGAGTGDIVRVPGQGNPGWGGGVPGDLLLELDVRDHPHFRRHGDDLEMDVPITLLEAIEGGAIAVPTPTGPKRVSLPPQCGGARLRLRGRGVQRPGRPGHLILHLRLQLPKLISDEVREACRVIEGAYAGDLRRSLDQS